MAASCAQHSLIYNRNAARTGVNTITCAPTRNAALGAGSTSVRASNCNASRGMTWNLKNTWQDNSETRDMKNTTSTIACIATILMTIRVTPPRLPLTLVKVLRCLVSTTPMYHRPPFLHRSSSPPLPSPPPTHRHQHHRRCHRPPPAPTHKPTTTNLHTDEHPHKRTHELTREHTHTHT